MFDLLPQSCQAGAIPVPRRRDGLLPEGRKAAVGLRPFSQGAWKGIAARFNPSGQQLNLALRMWNQVRAEQLGSLGRKGDSASPSKTVGMTECCTQEVPPACFGMSEMSFPALQPSTEVFPFPRQSRKNGFPQVLARGPLRTQVGRWA